MTMRTVEPSRQTAWDWRAAIQFICGGTGSGLIALTALAAWSDPAWLWRTGLVGAGFICLGLLSVFIKLGRRWRAFLVIMNPFTSWLTREALLAPVLLGLELLAVMLTNPILGSAAAVAGLSFLYAQARMLKEARSIPAWRDERMVWLIVATGLTEGASLLIVATALLGSPGGWLSGAFLILLAARYSAWTIYRRHLSAPGNAPIRTVDVLASMNPAVMLGHTLPLVLLLTLVLPGLGWLWTLAAGLAGLLSGWYLKFMLITRAAYNQGFALTHIPARIPGYGGPGVKPGWSPPSPAGTVGDRVGGEGEDHA
jgi:phenylacetyl-CoA:acceptor oxidoreductase subunit 2